MNGVEFGPELITQGGIVGVLAFVLWFVIMGGKNKWYTWGWYNIEKDKRITDLETECGKLREERALSNKAWQEKAEAATLEAERAKAMLDALVRGQNIPRN